MKYNNTCKEKGAALIVSLMILLVMTIIGVSALGNTSLEERMSQNFQHTNIAFQASESAIGKVIIEGDAGGTGIYTNPFYVQASDPLITALNAGVDDTSTTRIQDMDPQNHLANAELSATSVISYKSANHCPGMSVDDFICYNFDISAVATIDATNTRQEHLQGVARPAPNPNAG